MSKKKITILIIVVLSLILIGFTSSNKDAKTTWIQVNYPLYLHRHFPKTVEFSLGVEILDYEEVDNLNSDYDYYIENGKVALVYKLSNKTSTLDSEVIEYFNAPLIPQQTIFKVKIYEDDLKKIYDLPGLPIINNIINLSGIGLSTRSVYVGEMIEEYFSLNDDINTSFKKISLFLKELETSEHDLINELVENEKESTIIKGFSELKDENIDELTKTILISELVGSNAMVSDTETLLPEEVNISYLLKELKSTCLSKAYLTSYLLQECGIKSKIVLGNTQNGYHAVIQIKDSTTLVEKGLKFEPTKTIEVPYIQNFVNKYN